MNMNKICIIGTYFGALPKYFDLWLKSAGWNPKIDFFVFTDATIQNCPKNVYPIAMNLQRMKELAETNLEMPVSLNYAYKCCDFKVVYGIIFKDYIKQYDYWGHCDFDLIWGDIYSFLEKNNYEKYDRFLNLGHLSFYRNIDAVNAYYKQDGSECGNYQEVFTHDQIYGFDEWNGLDKIYEKHDYPIFSKRIFADISQIYYRYRLALDDKNYDYQMFYWDKGHVYRGYIDKSCVKVDEFIYIHFKKRPNFEIDDSVRNTDAFYITNHGFLKKDGINITKDIIQEVNSFKGRLHEKYELLHFKYISRIWNKIKNYVNRCKIK